MTAGRPGRRPLFVLAVLSGLFFVTAVVFHAMSWGAPVPPNMFGPRASTTVAGLVYAVAGAVIAARRPSNPIGWLCLAAGLIASFLGMCEAYAFWGLIERNGPLSLAVWAGWVQEWAFILWLLGMGLIAALFPEGRWLSGRWKVAILIGCAGALVGMVANALTPTFTIFVGFDNPVGIGGSLGKAIVGVGAGASWTFGLGVMVAGAASAVVRYRRSSGDERQQLKWLALATSVLVIGSATFGVVTLASGAIGYNPGGFDWVENIATLGVIALPIGIAVAVLKYRLYDIDRIISRSLGYALVTVLLVSVYAGLVLGIGSALGRTDSPVLIAGATLVVAALFRPARRRIQGAIDRRFHRRRYDAERALAGFSSTLRREGDLDELRVRLVQVVAETIDPSSVVVWFRESRRPG